MAAAAGLSGDYEMDSDRTEVYTEKKISGCVILLFTGIFLYLGGILYTEYAPYDNEFSDIVHFAIFNCILILAVISQAFNCIICIVFLIGKIRYTKTCVFVLLCSLVFMIYLIVAYELPQFFPNETLD
jgi:hypothetical protein